MGTNGHHVQPNPSSVYKIVHVPMLTIHQNKFAKGGLSKPNRLWAPATKPYPPAEHDTIIPLRNANNGLNGRRQWQRQRKRRQHTQPSTSKGAYVPVASVTRQPEQRGRRVCSHLQNINRNNKDHLQYLHPREIVILFCINASDLPRTASLRTTWPIKWVLIFSHASRGFSSTHARVADRHRLRSLTITNRALPSRFPGSNIVTQCTIGMLHAASLSSTRDKHTAVDNNNSNGEWRPRHVSSTERTIQNNANYATTIIQGRNIYNCDILRNQNSHQTIIGSHNKFTNYKNKTHQTTNGGNNKPSISNNNSPNIQHPPWQQHQPTNLPWE